MRSLFATPALVASDSLLDLAVASFTSCADLVALVRDLRRRRSASGLPISWALFACGRLLKWAVEPLSTSSSPAAFAPPLNLLFLRLAAWLLALRGASMSKSLPSSSSETNGLTLLGGSSSLPVVIIGAVDWASAAHRSKDRSGPTESGASSFSLGILSLQSLAIISSFFLGYARRAFFPWRLLLLRVIQLERPGLFYSSATFSFHFCIDISFSLKFSGSFHVAPPTE